MTAMYGLVLLVGLGALVVWVVAGSVSASVDGWDHLDPETRFGATGRAVVAGLVGFGMAGISMLYTDFPEWTSVVAAIVGSGALILVAARVVPPAEE